MLRVSPLAHPSRTHAQRQVKMRSKSVIGFLLFLSSLAVIPYRSSAQGSSAISGQVVDSRGASVSNAVVSIVDLGIQTRTDAAGRFVFTGIQPGDYTVTFRRSGLNSTSIRHVHAGESNLTATLGSSAVVINPVTVTASRGTTETGSSVLPVSQITEEGLRRDASISLAHSLVKLPGVRSVSTGQQIGKPMIRGFYGARVLSMQNGSRLEDYSWSEEDAPSIDPRLAQRVEVVRGPASVLYGSDALGGVVNVIAQDLPIAMGNQSFRRSRCRRRR